MKRKYESIVVVAFFSFIFIAITVMYSYPETIIYGLNILRIFIAAALIVTIPVLMSRKGPGNPASGFFLTINKTYVFLSITKVKNGEHVVIIRDINTHKTLAIRVEEDFEDLKRPKYGDQIIWDGQRFYNPDYPREMGIIRMDTPKKLAVTSKCR